MAFVTHIIAAEEEECAAVGESNCPLDEWSGIEAPGLDTMKLAMLHCILTGDSLQMALDLYEPIYVAESETVILRIADECLTNWPASKNPPWKRWQANWPPRKNTKKTSEMPTTFLLT